MLRAGARCSAACAPATAAAGPRSCQCTRDAQQMRHVRPLASRLLAMHARGVAHRVDEALAEHRRMSAASHGATDRGRRHEIPPFQDPPSGRAGAQHAPYHGPLMARGQTGCLPANCGNPTQICRGPERSPANSNTRPTTTPPRPRCDASAVRQRPGLNRRATKAKAAQRRECRSSARWRPVRQVLERLDGATTLERRRQHRGRGDRRATARRRGRTRRPPPAGRHPPALLLHERRDAHDRPRRSWRADAAGEERDVLVTTGACKRAPSGRYACTRQLPER